MRFGCLRHMSLSYFGVIGNDISDTVKHQSSARFVDSDMLVRFRDVIKAGAYLSVFNDSDLTTRLAQSYQQQLSSPSSLFKISPVITAFSIDQYCGWLNLIVNHQRCLYSAKYRSLNRWFLQILNWQNLHLTLFISFFSRDIRAIESNWRGFVDSRKPSFPCRYNRLHLEDA